MITVETYTIDNIGKYSEKYDNIAEFINELGELATDMKLKPCIEWDDYNAKGSFYIKDEVGDLISMGLIEEKRNRTRVTIEQVLNAIN